MLFATIRSWTVQDPPDAEPEELCKEVRLEIDPSAFPQPPAPAYITSGSQRGYYSNQRTRNQFRPRNANKGTSSYQLRQYAEATLGGGSLRKIVKLPEGEDENEWLAVNSMPLR